MRISKIEINGFGKIKDSVYTFDEDVNSFVENNGWGKSTLASFIRVMFYGFEGEEKKACSEREREQMSPWGADVYGGSIWFSVNDKNYYLHRTFGRKKKTDDTFTLKNADTNVDTKDFIKAEEKNGKLVENQNIGEAIFGIDALSFMRTSYISRDYYNSNEMGKGVTNSISAKLGNLADDTKDVNNYDVIKDKIKKASNSLGSKTKGKIGSLTSEISNLERDILRKNGLNTSLKETTELLDDEKKKMLHTSEAIKALRIEQTNTSDAERLISLKKQLEGLTDRKNKAEEELLAKKKELPDELPSDEEIQDCLNNIRLLNSKKSELNGVSLSEDELDNYREISNTFMDKVPDRKAIDDMVAKVGQIKIDKTQLNTIDMSKEEIATLSKYKDRFDGCNKNLADVDKCLLDIGTQSTLEMTVITNRAILSNAKDELKKEKEDHIKSANNTTMLIVGFGAVVLLIGIVCILLGLKNMLVMAVGAVIALVGVVLVVVGLVKKAGASKKAYTNDELTDKIRDLEATIRSDEGQIAQIEQEQKEVLEAFSSPYVKDRAFECLMKLHDELDEYKILARKETIYKDSNLHSSIENNTKSVLDFVRLYNVSCTIDDAEEYLYKLINMLNVFNSLSDKKNKAALLSEEVKTIDTKIDAFALKNNLKNGDLIEEATLNLKDSIRDYFKLQQESKDRQKELESFMADKNLEAINNVDVNREYRSLEAIAADIVANEEELDIIKAAIGQYNERKSDIVEDLSDIEDKEVLLQDKNEELKAAEKKAKTLKVFGEILTEAKESLSNRFTAPVMNGFEKYIGIVTGNDKGVVIKTDMSVEYRELGDFRRPDSLSSGYKDLIDFSLRMGLVDAMYTSDKPVLIVDDPFVNLDRDKLVKIPDLLKEIAKEYQVIYFTCHDSRAIE